MNMTKRLIAVGNCFLRVLESIRVRIQPYTDLWLRRIADIDRSKEHQGFLADTDYAIVHQEPLRAKIFFAVVSIAFFLFVIWAAFSEIDEITRGDGKVIPSRQLQVLQSLDGGVVSEILVREGEIVQPNQILLRIDATRANSSAKEGRGQYIAVLAKAARLRALANGTKFTIPAEIELEAPKTIAEERQLYESRQQELRTNLSISRQQLLQRQQDLVETRARYEQAAKSYELSMHELSVTKPLLASGAVSEIELLRLERDASRFRGERDISSAQIIRIQAAIHEAARKVEEVELVFRNEAGRELAETMAKLNSLADSSAGLSDRVNRSILRSPVKGTVKRLLVNTVGGVLQPGRDVIEIVPLEDTLLLEARVQPRDIAFLRPGQKAIVKFSSYDFSLYGGLEGKLEHIGADSVLDEKGNAYYTIRVRTNKNASLGRNLPIIPGMVAEIDILTGKKSVLSYLFKPMLRVQSRAFSER